MTRHVGGVPALPGRVPTRRNPPPVRPQRVSLTAFEAYLREEDRRAAGRDRPGPATGLPVVQEFVVARWWRLEGRGAKLVAYPTDEWTLHRIVRRTREFVIIEAAPWEPWRWQGWDRPLRTRRLSRARIDAGKSDGPFRLARADDAPAAAALRILGLTPPATAVEIRRAFRRAARHLHPDVGGSADAFRRLTAVYADALAWVTATGSGGPA